MVQRLEIQKTGGFVPNFTLPDGQGQIIKLSDFAKIHNIVLFFLKNGDTEMAHTFLKDLARYYDTYRNQNAEVLAIIPCGTLEEGQKLKSEFGLPFPVLVDEACIVSQQFVPDNHAGIFIIDRNRHLYWQVIAHDASELPTEQSILEWLSFIETQSPQ